jgi:AcrR family transcriptional regulator
MVATPWGDTEGLRTRKLPPGRSTPPEDVARNQRERLFAATVATCETRGYEASSVADVLELSGISSKTFYEQFEDKRDCFRSATEEILDGTLAVIARRLGEGEPTEERARVALDAFVDLVVSQPAAARMVFVESYAAGEPAVEPVRRTIDEFGRLARVALKQIPGHEATPIELARAIVGGIYRIVHDRLRRHREEELPALVPALWRWALNYEPPPQPLRLHTRRGKVVATTPMPPFAAQNPEQRIIRAFAAVVGEKGYGQTTIADIAAAASISQGTFYEYFEDKDDAMAATLDSSGAQMLAATLPAARRAPNWPRAVRVAIGTTLDFLAAEPAFAQLRMVAIYGAGPKAITRRDAAGMEMLGTLLGPGFTDSPQNNPIVLEAVIGAIYGALYDRLRAGGAETLPKLAPLLTYLALAPFLGAEEACAIANGNGRRGGGASARVGLA